MKKSLLLAATALTAHAAFAQAPSSTPTPQTDLAAQMPASTTSSSLGVPSASPTMTTTATSSGGCQVPAPAAGAGYNQMTYGPDMALGANWFPVTGDNATSGVSQNADGSITIRGGDANHYNDQLNSGGVEFGGGGYFQATLSFKNPPAGWSTSADGWPAFWMSPQKDIGGGVEVDFFEFMKAGSPIFGTGMIDWGRGGLNTGSNEGGDVSIPAGFDPSQPHDYGFLWVPATGGSQGYGQAYLDGQPVGIKHTWSAGTMFDGIDRNQAQVQFGTGSANPMTIYNAQVWQKDSSADTGIVGTTTGNSGGACPTVVAANSTSPSTPTGGTSKPPRGSGATSTSPSASTPSSSTGITPQTDLQQALNMGSPSTAGQLASLSNGEWGSFSSGGSKYDVTIIDPPGAAGPYEVLIQDGGTPYIVALPASFAANNSGSSTPGATQTSSHGAGTVSSQWGNPTSTDMSATPSGITTSTDPTTGAQTTTLSQTSTDGTPLSATISNQTGGGGTSLTNAPASGANNSGGGGGRGRRSHQASNSASGGPNAAMAANTPSNNPSSTGSGSSGSSNPSASAGATTPATSGSGSGSGGLSGSSNLSSLQDQMNATAQGSNEYGGVPITLQPGDITYNSGGSLTDAHGNVWTLEPMTGQFAGVPMATVAKNGQQMDPMGGGGFVAALRIVNGEAVWENAKGKGWYNESTYVGSSPTG